MLALSEMLGTYCVIGPDSKQGVRRGTGQSFAEETPCSLQRPGTPLDPGFAAAVPVGTGAAGPQGSSSLVARLSSQ